MLRKKKDSCSICNILAAKWMCKQNAIICYKNRLKPGHASLIIPHKMQILRERLRPLFALKWNIFRHRSANTSNTEQGTESNLWPSAHPNDRPPAYRGLIAYYGRALYQWIAITMSFRYPWCRWEMAPLSLHKHTANSPIMSLDWLWAHGYHPQSFLKHAARRV